MRRPTARRGIALPALAIVAALSAGCDAPPDPEARAHDAPSAAAPAVADGAAEAAGVAPGGDARRDEVVAVDHAWIRLPPSAAPVAAGYLRLINHGDVDDRLVAVRSDAAATVEIHEMTMDGGVMRMRALPAGVPMPAGEIVALEPGGLHLMLQQPRAGLAAGQRIAATLVFEQAGERVVEFEVRDATAVVPVDPVHAAPMDEGTDAGADPHAGH